MTSVALADWNAKRAASIDLAWQMHSMQVAAPSPAGSGWEVEQALAVVLQRMATEFQGFCRALHDEASEFFASTAAQGNLDLESTLRKLLTRARGLDSGNAQSKSISQDYSRFGFIFWQAMQVADGRAGAWPEELAKFNEMRNAVAHDDTAKMYSLNSKGYALDAPTLQNWHTMLDDIATLMDDVVSLSLSALLGVSRPW
ncbi:hypothetical protein [Streptomyces sp. NPDC051576]|uniref:hypothetical protein n=1 Tax=Streptomyces sp. NPDC051576 TaxID=3155803 RepID=UPI00342A413B